MSENHDKSSRPSGPPWIVWASLVAALAIFVLATAVIYYRFMTTPETNCTVVVSGNASLEGSTVIVERLTQDPSKKSTYRDTLNRGNQYHARFFLTSGTYSVEVLDTSAQRMAMESDFIPPGTRLTLDLNRRYPASRPAVPRPR